MGRDKALLPWRGTTFLAAQIELLRPRTECVLVVAGKNCLSLQPVVEANGALLAVNQQPEMGQFSSLQTGLREALARGCDAVIFSLVDRPPVQPRTLQLLRQSFGQATEGIWAIHPEYAGRRGHPILLGREMISAFLRAPASSTAREVQDQHRERISCLLVDDPLTIANVNTPAEYEELAAQNLERQHPRVVSEPGLMCDCGSRPNRKGRG
jgi:molybdenum cofactor cytidylyltransferase